MYVTHQGISANITCSRQSGSPCTSWEELQSQSLTFWTAYPSKLQSLRFWRKISNTNTTGNKQLRHVFQGHSWNATSVAALYPTFPHQSAQLIKNVRSLLRWTFTFRFLFNVILVTNTLCLFEVWNTWNFHKLWILMRRFTYNFLNCFEV